VSVRPRTRVATSHGPIGTDGALAVDRYLLALAGHLPTGSDAFDALSETSSSTQGSSRQGAVSATAHGATSAFPATYSHAPASAQRRSPTERTAPADGYVMVMGTGKVAIFCGRSESFACTTIL
jgi:hypothetical protein